MNNIKKFLIMCLLFVPIQVSAFHGYLLGNVGSSFLTGFTQVPQGGSNGTTSYRRPTLNELNIHHNNFYTIGSRLAYQDYDATFTYSRFAPRGATKIKNILNTHGKVINAGSSLETLLKYDFYTLAIDKHFYYDLWTFSPYAQLNVMKFHYEYAAFPIRGARTYSVCGANLGLKMTYQFMKTLSVDLNIAPPLPIFNFTNGVAEWGFNKEICLTQKMTLYPRIAMGLQQLDYEDNQTVPNHVRIKNAPYGLVGLQLKCF